MPTRPSTAASSVYIRGPAVGSTPVSRLTSSTLRPPMPPTSLRRATAASSELFVMVPMKAPMPEKGATTPTLTVSLAPPPPSSSSSPPRAQAASTDPDSTVVAAAPTPARPAHSRKRRRVIGSPLCSVTSAEVQLRLHRLVLRVLRGGEGDDRLVGDGPRGRRHRRLVVDAVGEEDARHRDLRRRRGPGRGRDPHHLARGDTDLELGMRGHLGAAERGGHVGGELQEGARGRGALELHGQHVEHEAGTGDVGAIGA